MSAEKINISDSDNLSPSETPIFKDKEIKGRVDINHLLARVRDEKKKEKKINLIFFSMFASLVIVVGIILSL